MGLKRELGLADVFSIAAGAMISSGLFVLPGIAFAQAGPGVVLSYFLAGLLMVPSMLAKAELATAMPRSGGSYFFIERSLGPLVGTFAGLANWLSIAMKAAFALVGIGTLAHETAVFLGLAGNAWAEGAIIKGSAIACCLIFAILNLVSAKGTGRLQVALVAALLAILAAFVARGLPVVDSLRLVPFAPKGIHPILAAAGMVFVSFGGLTKIADVSEEIRNPGRTIPLGMLLAFGTVNVLYVLAVLVAVGTLPAEQLAGSYAPIAMSANVTFGTIGFALTSVAALLAFATTANAGILSAARSPMAMARDGLLPSCLAATSKRFNTPHRAIFVTSALMCIAIAALSVENLVKLASTILIVLFMLDNASVIVMRQSGLKNYRPTFRVPLYPWLPIAAILLYVFVLIEMGSLVLGLAGLFALCTCGWYLIYVHRRFEGESALLNLVRNILPQDFDRSGLEEELKYLALERDEIELDRFDHLVSEGQVLDLDGPRTASQLFRAIAEASSPRTGVPQEDLYRLFLKRERESSTVVTQGVAVPHVLVDGQGVFDVVVVRCKEGVHFSELGDPVTIVFALIGSRDERNFHLKALMSIAHIVQEPGFRTRWQAAESAEDLRDIILLSGRARHVRRPAAGETA